MTHTAAFIPYTPEHQDACLALFDENCPQFFAPNERDDYRGFLDQQYDGYCVCELESKVVGAFGLLKQDDSSHALNWILLSPTAQGIGLGKQIMAQVVQTARDQRISEISIAASHLSAPFFAKFAAKVIKETPNGWGGGMHRVDMILHVKED
ncbi:GNAT family N-acetyltransferase [Psychrobium sp. MM17-31]|uniref:GNAT family N-acetyltransferase n=1 Tax=Psychrobium sp. MM17-31 TaxID=2917758 RepID=UPI001EF424A3|nr:GNAT family N-acetyltransferase [Psychrobium sp. MM17-31]MCG7530001.1 GNAT family N-acetyltransferase [Psychrobium sp. MM17-31]